MRAFINQILDTIDAASLTDAEFATFTASMGFGFDMYNQILAVLDGRGTMGHTRDRLTALFKAHGTEVVVTTTANSKIFFGDAL